MRPRNPLRGLPAHSMVASWSPVSSWWAKALKELKLAAFNARRDSDDQAVLSLANQWRAAGVTSVRHRRLGEASVLIVQSKEILMMKLERGSAGSPASLPGTSEKAKLCDGGHFAPPRVRYGYMYRTQGSGGRHGSHWKDPQTVRPVV